MNEYAVIATETEANEIIKLINQTKKFSGTWAYPMRHPIDHTCLIPVDWNQLHGCESILTGLEIITRREAQTRGWYFGPFIGTFARERQKMEDIHFLFDAIVEAYGKPNFPALRSLILSFLSACYALKESIKQKNHHQTLKPVLGTWWADRLKELDAKNELLHTFERYMNTEKHGGALAGQHATIDIFPAALMTSLIIREYPLQADPNTLHISSEGAFMTAHKDTPMERRFPVGIHEAHYEVVVDNPPTSHLGKPIAGLTLLMMLQNIKDYYANLLFAAVCLVGEGPQSPPAIAFEGNTNMAVSQSSENV